MSPGIHETKRPTTPALVLVLAFVAAGGPAFGGSGWPGHGMHHGKFWKKSKVCRKLQLTGDEVLSGNKTITEALPSVQPVARAVMVTG